MQPIKLVVFDLWKTLAFRDVDYNTTTKMVKDLKIPLSETQFQGLFEKTIQAQQWKDELAGYKKLCTLAGIGTKHAQRMQEIRVNAEKESKLFPETIDFLQELKTLGIKLGLITNSTRTSIEFIAKTGVLDYLDYRVYSYEVGSVKPQKSIYEVIWKLARVKPHHCLMIGDNKKNDVIVPRSLGMNAIHFINFESLQKEFKSYIPAL